MLFDDDQDTIERLRGMGIVPVINCDADADETMVTMLLNHHVLMFLSPHCARIIASLAGMFFFGGRSRPSICQCIYVYVFIVSLSANYRRSR